MKDNVPMSMFAAPRFDVAHEELEIKKYLADHGYVVLKTVADAQRVEQGKAEFWDFMESCTQGLHSKGKLNSPLDRARIETWQGQQWLPSKSNGIMKDYGFNHSDFLWNTRLLPKVNKAFEIVWDSEELIVSFDAGNAFRPWKYNPEFLTRGGWWHVDQNGLKANRAGKVCVQGLVTYYDATEDTGGFAVIPGSQFEFGEISKRSPTAKAMNDFIHIEKNDPLLLKSEGRIPEMKAGDMVLWDSRTVHCNSPALTTQDYQFDADTARKTANQELIRLVAYTCMLPRSHVGPFGTQILENRKKAFMHRIGTTHWPTQQLPQLNSDMTFHRQHTVEYLRQFSKDQLKLVGYTDSELKGV